MHDNHHIDKFDLYNRVRVMNCIESRVNKFDYMSAKYLRRKKMHIFRMILSLFDSKYA